MTDVTTQKPLRVSTSTVGPYLRLPLSQLDDVRRLLDEHGIRYSVEENAISLDGGPYRIIIDFGRKGDAEAIQTILDNAQEPGR